MTSEIHITKIKDNGDVWGHETTACDAGGCAGGADGYYSNVSADDVEEGHTYEIDENGKVLAEVE
jgi:hypothetical protein